MRLTHRVKPVSCLCVGVRVGWGVHGHTRSRGGPAMCLSRRVKAVGSLFGRI